MSKYRYEIGGVIRDTEIDFPYHTDEIIELLEEKDQQITDLEAKLAEEKEYTQQYRKECAKIQTDYYQLKQQLAEKEKERHEEWETGKEWKWEWQKVNQKLEKAEQDKISFAVEQLENVKEHNDNLVCDDEDYYNYITAFIDNQIKQLKEMK